MTAATIASPSTAVVARLVAIVAPASIIVAAAIVAAVVASVVASIIAVVVAAAAIVALALFTAGTIIVRGRREALLAGLELLVGLAVKACETLRLRLGRF